MGAILLTVQDREWIDMDSRMKPHELIFHMEHYRMGKRYDEKFLMKPNYKSP